MGTSAGAVTTEHLGIDSSKWTVSASSSHPGYPAKNACDGKYWKQVHSGSFGNILNAPSQRSVYFSTP